MTRTRKYQLAVFIGCAIALIAVPIGMYQNRNEPTFGSWAVVHKVPVRVQWGADLASASEWIIQAMDATNRDIGCVVLMPGGPESKVTLITSASRAACGGHQLRHEGRPTTVYCSDGTIDVVLDRLGEGVMTVLTAEHEFGHVLGLVDDDDEPGTMSPRIEDRGMPRQKFSPADRKAVNQRYCGPPTAGTAAPAAGP